MAVSQARLLRSEVSRERRKSRIATDKLQRLRNIVPSDGKVGETYYEVITEHYEFG